MIGPLMCGPAAQMWPSVCRPEARPMLGCAMAVLQAWLFMVLLPDTHTLCGVVYNILGWSVVPIEYGRSDPSLF